MRIGRNAESVWEWLFLAGLATAACAEQQVARETSRPTAEPGAVAEPARAAAPPACQAPRDRPAAGEAEVRERRESDIVQVEFAATPSDAVCETLDIRLRLRSGLVVGEPDRQVEVVWSSERDIDTGARLSFLVGGSPVAVPSEVARSGSRVVVSSRAPVALLARYGSETRPTIVVSGRKIELSERQTRQLHGLLQHLPPYRVVRRGGAAATASRSTEARKRLDAADPAAGNGWFCVEAPGDSPRQRTSSCHRTSAECEQRRASLGAAAPAGDCAWSSTASCYVWQRPAKSGRSCFYRPSQCQRDKMIRDEAEQQPGSLWTSACYSAP